MSSKITRFSLILMLVAGLLISLAPVGAAPAPQKADPLSKIDPWVLSHTHDGAQSSFIVVMQAQADTSGAAALKTKEEKGRYVYDLLTRTAKESQAGLRADLDAQGVAYRAYWIVNVLTVESGTYDLALNIAARDDVALISANPSIHYSMPSQAQLDAQDEALNSAVDAVTAAEWGITNTRADTAWTQGATGTGIVIGGEDTGYRWTHSELKAKYRGWNGTTADHNYNWWDSSHTGGGTCGANSTQPCDDDGHGTHTMGTMVGGDGSGVDTNDIGMAYNAKWIGCRNMNVGAGTPTTYLECQQFMLAPTDLAGNNANPAKAPHVINNSWGCPTSEGCTNPNILQTSVQNIVNAGIVYVASAGNEGPNCSTVGDPPAIYAAAFSVASHTSGNAMSSFSSRGPVTVDGSNRRKPDISGPGSNVRSATNTSDTAFATLSGTSMAGPHVAGAVALLLSARPSLIGHPAQVITAFQNTANPAISVTTGVTTCGGIASSTIPNNHFGYGRIDVVAALAATGGATPTPTVVTPGTPTATRTPTQVASNTPTATPFATTNDDFNGATLLTTPMTTTLNTSSYTTATDDPALCAGTPATGSHSVWFKYVGQEIKTLNVDTFTSNYDTVLALYTGTRGALTRVACNDDASGGTQSSISIGMGPGATTYYIEVAAYGSGAAGTTVVHISTSGGTITPTPSRTPTATPTTNCGLSIQCTTTPSVTPTRTTTATPTPTATGIVCPNLGGTYCRTNNEARTWIAGSTSTGITGDDQAAAVTLPFAFNFMGTSYTSINISSNGNAHFGTSSTAYSNVAVPGTGAPNAMIAPFWDDLDPAAGGAIYTAVSGTAPNRTFTIEWRDVRAYNTGTSGITFEIQLVETSNHIWVLYQDTVFGSTTIDAGLSATSGIENSGGTAGNQYSFNSAVLSNGLTLHYWKP